MKNLSAFKSIQQGNIYCKQDEIETIGTMTEQTYKTESQNLLTLGFAKPYS